VSTGRLYRTEGIVIRRREQGEADRVLTLCTPSGKVAVLAKGARKVKSRKAGHIELFTRSDFVLSRVPNYWDIISQAETIEAHSQLRGDLLRGTYARYVGELFDRFFTEGEGSAAAYDLLGHTLTWLCENDDLDLIARFYEQHLLGLAGFRPELFRCVAGHDERVLLQPREQAEDRRPYGFDPGQGGGLCQSCYAEQKQRQDVIALSPNGLWFLQECQRGPYTRLRKQSITPTIHDQVERVMHHYITYHLEQDVKAGAFLRQVKQASR
jgi:DNA repair protein RecO (recombination protein O)